MNMKHADTPYFTLFFPSSLSHQFTIWIFDRQMWQSIQRSLKVLLPYPVWVCSIYVSPLCLSLMLSFKEIL